MSPFAHLLQQLRVERNLRQAELAELVGYDQTYISALEVGLKGPPPFNLVERLQQALGLSDDETRALTDAIGASRRRYVIEPGDTDIHQDVYLLLRDLWARLPELTATQVRILSDVLRCVGSAEPPISTRRRRRQPRREAAM